MSKKILEGYVWQFFGVAFVVAAVLHMTCISVSDSMVKEVWLYLSVVPEMVLGGGLVVYGWRYTSEEPGSTDSFR